jgi:formylglycine-generating enzyme required for sulfatase activity|tara:strand:+ start:9046 stop:11142 length:2097 start_codon:yes stop_codon:yes gene_type:complete
MTAQNDKLEKEMDPGHSPNNQVIEPVSFTRAATEVRRGGLRIKPIPLFVTAVFAVLAVAVWFMFTAKAVNFLIEPTPETVRIEGGLFSYELGGRHLLRPGTYVLYADRQGYRTLEQIVEVGAAPDQEISLSMVKLPGILTVTTIPEGGSDVFVDQRFSGKTPTSLADISPGLHDIAIHSERYLPYDTEIEIEGMQIEQKLDVELSPAWADITLATQPVGAGVTVDGDEHGQTPLTTEILQGIHDIEVKLAGYKSWQTQIEVIASEAQTLLPIALIKSDGRISLQSNPAKANVTVSGEYRGQTPLNLILAPGDYTLALSKAGYSPANSSISVRPEEDIDLNIKLEPVLAVVSLVVTPAGAELILDGDSKGDPNQRLMLTAANHRLEITKEGYATFSTVITPRPGFDQQLRIDLKTVEQAKAESIPQTIMTASGQEMRLVIPAELAMGAPRREPGRRSNEAQRLVSLTRPYYASTKEITNAEFLVFSASHSSGSVGRALLNQEERPVVNVTWEQAVAYANWLSAKDSLPSAYEERNGKWVGVTPLNTGYRLPTEAEWAWIARYAGTKKTTRFPWGNAMPPTEKSGNYADISARDLVPYHIKAYSDGFLGSSPGGSFRPNPLGLYDLEGNVSEWIHDIYLPDPSLSGEDSVDPTGPEQGDYHVIRGASFMHGRFSELRWTYRDYGAKERPDVGFRIVRYLE